MLVVLSISRSAISLLKIVTDVVDAEEGLVESGGRVLDKVSTGSRAIVLGEDVASPVTTESEVDDDLQITEVGSLALSEGEVSVGGAPGSGSGGLVVNIGRDLATGEEPDLDTVSSPGSSENATTILVEGSTK